MIRQEAEFVVVGSGPGGAAVARALARAGRDVLVLERGRDWRHHPLYGSYAGVLAYADRGALLFTPEGMNIIRPLMLGGATSMFCGCAADPPDWWLDRYGVDLHGYAANLRADLNVKPLAPELRGEASTRIAGAAGDLGMEWQPQDKFVWPGRVPEFDCGAKCMLGCRCHAKWNAAEWVDDAVNAGAHLATRALVDQVLVNGSSVVGVRGKAGLGRSRFTVEAGTVVLAAGGIGSPVLARTAGIAEAGVGFAMDTTALVYGVSPDRGAGFDPPMTWSHEDADLGVMYSTLVDPWLSYPIALLRSNPARALSWHRWRNTLGVMIKLTDEVSGGIDERGRVNKGLTSRDDERLTRAREVARSILERAGCDRADTFEPPLRGTHPSATVRLGEALSMDLETRIAGLYVCDASVFPQALGRPTVLTILALAHRLADHLLARR